MCDGTGLAEALVGLGGFRVLEVTELDAEVVIDIETTAELAGCGECEVRAQAQDWMPIEIRDLACFGRAARLVWHKRRWRCVDPHCEARTWTETSPHISTRTVLTRRAGWEACRQVGANARPVAGLVRELGVCWPTVMEAVVEHGTPLVDDPGRVGPVINLGVDEASFLKANRHHATRYATGLVDLDRRMVIDMVEGNAAADLRLWCSDQSFPASCDHTSGPNTGGRRGSAPALMAPFPAAPRGPSPAAGGARSARWGSWGMEESPLPSPSKRRPYWHRWA